jgi:hypothetical protein
LPRIDEIPVVPFGRIMPVPEIKFNEHLVV